MKFVIVFAAVLALAVALPAGTSPDADATVVRSESDNIGVEGYKYGYETSNGISQDEQGHVINAGTDDEAIAVSGTFKYTGDDGVVYSVSYVADENGFQPQGAHIPAAEH